MCMARLLLLPVLLLPVQVPALVLHLLLLPILLFSRARILVGIQSFFWTVKDPKDLPVMPVEPILALPVQVVPIWNEYVSADGKEQEHTRNTVVATMDDEIDELAFIVVLFLSLGTIIYVW